MADNRSRLEKLLGMLGSDHDGERAAAALMIANMAKKEGKTIADLCLSGKERIVYVDKIVYRDRAPERGPPREDVWNEFRKAQERADAERRARQQQRADRQRAERAQRYGGAFDDAEMTDEEREAVRARRAANKQRGKGRRDLLDELEKALHEGLVYLDPWEVEFAMFVPAEYETDAMLTPRQVHQAKKIIAKVQQRQGFSPI